MSGGSGGGFVTEDTDDGFRNIEQILEPYESSLYGKDDFRQAAFSFLANRRCAAAPLGETPRVFDRLCAKGVNLISAEERERALAEVNGVYVAIEENEALINTCISTMVEHLERLPYFKTCAYRLSLQMDSKYASNFNFQLMFLRSVRFNPCRAAECIALHFVLKLELFGPDLLVKDIDMKDLDTEALLLLGTGEFLRPLDMRDRAGRKILITTTSPCTNLASLMRACWYTLFSAVNHDPVTQTRGIVMVGRDSHSIGYRSIRVLRAITFVFRAIPVQIMARHTWEDGRLDASVISKRIFMRPDGRIRLRQYFDISMEEYHRELRRYGIPIEIFSIRSSCERRMVFLTQLQMMAEILHGRQQDSNDSRTTAVIAVPFGHDRSTSVDRSNTTTRTTPTRIKKEPSKKAKKVNDAKTSNPKRIWDVQPNDIIFGRGRSRSHNSHVYGLVKKLLPEHRTATKKGKTDLCAVVVASVHKAGGRFLKLAEDDIELSALGTEVIDVDTGGYVEVSDSEARSKIGRFFYRFRENS